MSTIPGVPPLISIGGIRVMQNDYLPPQTMMVSPDVYKLLTATPEQHAENQRIFEHFEHQVETLQTLLKAKGLSPTGRKLQELPK